MTIRKVLVLVLVMGAVALGAVPGQPIHKKDATTPVWCEYTRDAKGNIHVLNIPCQQPPWMHPKIIIIDVSVTPVGPTDPVTDSAQ
jgi:hypothetical protein